MLAFSRWKLAGVLLILAVSVFLFLPNVLPASLTRYLPEKTVRLGLDLQGGSYVVLEVDGSLLEKEKLRAALSEAQDVLGSNGITASSSPSEAAKISLLFDNAQDLQKALPLLRNGLSASQVALTAAPNNPRLLLISLPPTALQKDVQQAGARSLEILRRRVDAMGTREAVVQLYGSNRILVEVPGLSDPASLVALLGRMAKLNFHFLDTDRQALASALEGHIPEDDKLLYMHRSGTRIPVLVKQRVSLDGAHLTDAQVAFDEYNNPCITFRLNAAGTASFSRITRENVGRPFAIVLDDEVLSIPTISEPIPGGAGQIKGQFTVTEATQLAALLRAGALPAPLKLLEQHTVGANLGADAIRYGLWSSLAGFVLVVLFMIVCYGLLGFFASLALLANLLLIGAILSLLQATLTLPGIAGIVLTLGMAVDANVLIFERMREEMALGKSPAACIEAGYKKALGTIMDSNLTTLLAALILFCFGSGPIRGFSVTLTVGILTSLFTAYTVSGLILAVWFRQRRPKVLPL